MKNIVKIFAGVTLLLTFAGCTKNFEKYNTDPYAVMTADPSILLPTMIDAMMYVQQNDSQMIDQMVGTLGGYFTLSNRWGGQNFDTFNVSDGWNAIPYEAPFLDIYGNFFDIEKATSSSGHYYALARLVRAAAMLRVADCYGPIPYSKVTDGQMYVAYDSNEDVYHHIINDLRYASDQLYLFVKSNEGSMPMGEKDALYSGDYSKWAKLANSLIMRVALRGGDDYKEDFITAYNSPAGYIRLNDDNAMMNPAPQTNPYNLAASTWGDIRANASIVDYMTGYQDPRTSAYFTKASIGSQDYLGMRSGKLQFEKSEVSGYSQPNFGAGSRLPVFVAAETEFILAEVALRHSDWGVSGSPQSHYEAGIRLSMAQWGVSSGTEEYISNTEFTPGNHQNDPVSGFGPYTRNTKVKIAWGAESAEEKHFEQIITQKWIANYPMGIEAWSEYRRTGYPELNPAVDPNPNYMRGMRRLRYSYNEDSYNKANKDAAVAEFLGGSDTQTKDLFWAKKN